MLDSTSGNAHEETYANSDPAHPPSNQLNDRRSFPQSEIAQPVAIDAAALVSDSLSPVQKFPRKRSAFRQYVLPCLLLTVSIVTTTAIGARYMQNFLDGRPTVVTESDLWPWPWLLESPYSFLLGWPFSITLLGILLSHEFGHYFACRAHKIQCTLPIVLPAPTLSGTAGAVIQIRGRIPDNEALLDVGIYGPLAGYAASLAAIIIGWLLSRPLPAVHPAPLLEFGQPLTLIAIHAILSLIDPAIPAFSHTLRHPMLIAGWVGLFITALNLIPGGQLDGGHILYSISPRWHLRVSRALPFLLVLSGLFFWLGWILWAIILWLPAMRHPRLPDSRPLGPRRRLLAACAPVILLLTLAAAPFEGSSILHYLPIKMLWTQASLARLTSRIVAGATL